MEDALRNEFAELLYSVEASDFKPSQSNYDSIEAVSQWILDYIPDKLYRFRACNSTSLEALKENQIWGSSAHRLNDVLECIPSYNEKAITGQIEKFLDPQKLKQLVENFKKDKAWQDLYRLKSDNTIVDELLNNMPDNVNLVALDNCLRQLAPLLLGLVKARLPSNIELFFKQIEEYESHRSIACFSENLRSTLMWGHYASGHTGFAIEYNMRDHIHRCPGSCDKDKSCSSLHHNTPFAPVIYADQRVDATKYLMQLVEWDLVNFLQLPIKNSIYYDKFIATKTILTKSKDWVYEKEWRMFSKVYESTAPERYKCISEGIKPTAVYLGAKTSGWYMVRIKNICSKNDIPCYKMQPSYDNNNFELSVIE